MKAPLKRMMSGLLWTIGITALARKLIRTPKIAILMYHKVERVSFENQVSYLKKHYNIISEKELIEFYYKKKVLPKNSVLITFDDGYLNNYEVAYPILKKYAVPAIIFLTTGFINKNKMPWYDLITYLVNHSSKECLVLDGEKFRLFDKGRKRLLMKYYHYMITAGESEFKRLLDDLALHAGVKIPKEPLHDAKFMTWKQAKEMMPLVSFGSHTVNHYVVPNLSIDIMKSELKESKEVIEKRLGVPCLSFCFPNGDFNHVSIDLVKKIGYKMSFSTLFGRNAVDTSPFQLKRFGINIDDNRNVFAFKLTKLSNIFKKWKQSSHFRVIMLTNYYFPQRGGITTVVHQLHSSLKKRNIKSIVIPFPNLFRKIEKLARNSSLVHKILVVIYSFYVQVYLLLTKIFHKKVIVHSHAANFCARTASIAQIYGVKTVHTFHTHLGMYSQTPRHTSFFDKLDVLTSVSKSLGKDNKKAFGIKKPVRTIFNGVDVPMKRKISYYKGGTIRLLFVGHLFKIKDPMLFVKSVEQLVSQGKKVEAVMIGDGDLYDEIASYLKNRSLSMISLLGSVPRKKVSEYYRWADVFVSTSKGEGLGVVLLEAMATGTPVVATDSEGSLEVINHQRTGYLVKSRDPKDVCKGVSYALAHSAFLAKNASLVIRKDFNWDDLVNEYIKMYRRISLERGVENSEE